MQQDNVADDAQKKTGTALTIRSATSADLQDIEMLHARAFGPGRFSRTAYRVREETKPISKHCHVAIENGKLVGAVRMTEITIGKRPGALLLGPLAVDPALTNTGLGAQLIARALQSAKKDGIELIVLVGDEPYYKKQGFSVVPPGSITFPGPVNPARILAVELKPKSLKKFSGPLIAQSVTRP